MPLVQSHPGLRPGHLGADFSLSSLSMKNMIAGGFIKWTCYSLCNVRGHPPSIVHGYQHPPSLPAIAQHLRAIQLIARLRVYPSLCILCVCIAMNLVMHSVQD